MSNNGIAYESDNHKMSWWIEPNLYLQDKYLDMTDLPVEQAVRSKDEQQEISVAKMYEP